MIFINEFELYQELIKNLMRYHPEQNFDIVKKAYELASSAHKNQFRKSGEPYIIHPLSVAIILSSLELDLESIAAGILHDIIEDTHYSYDDIKNIFGQEIADIVDGVTKLDKIKYVSQEELQAENYRKMFLAMAKDIRVVLIKIADRLHNMRTLSYMKPEKQKQKAQETLDIYAPIAHRLGISKIRYQLEDLSFYYLQPKEYKNLSEKVKLCQSERIAYVEKIIEQIKESLAENGIEAKVEGRPKHFFSIYKKMVAKNKTFDQIYDLFAVRAIVKTVHDCYAVLGIVHEMYKPIPGRFKDYIAMPKSNMYQSLHSTLIGPEGEPFEIQIRTEQMHRVAEYGIAAHWKYKSGKFNSNDKKESEKAKLQWLKQILEWQKELNNNKDYLDAIKFDLNIYQSHVYCFSPRGQVISLLSGSNPIDFAYAIHSAVGNKMVGAKVNGKIVPLDYVLKTGDRVEIITSQNSTGPKLNWLKIVKTNHAKTKINHWFKHENKLENIQRGKELLEKEAKKKNVALSDMLTQKAMDLVMEKYNFNNFETVYAAVGHGAIKEGNVINRLYAEYKRANKIEDAPKKISDNQNKKSQPIIVNGVGDVNVRFSKCCNPVLGDEIVGFITRGRGVSLHRTDCKNIINLDDFNRQRLIEAHWHNEKENTSYYTEIKLICDDITGILANITKLLANEKIMLRTINSHTNKSKVIFNIGFDIGDKEKLAALNNKLLAIDGVCDVERNKK